MEEFLKADEVEESLTRFVPRHGRRWKHFDGLTDDFKKKGIKNVLSPCNCGLLVSDWDDTLKIKGPKK